MILVVMLSHHLLVVVSTVSDDAIQWLSLTMPFGRLIFSSSLQCSCSCIDHAPSRCTCRYTWHRPCARCTYHLQLLAGFPPGMLSASSPGVLAVTCLGIHMIVFWFHLSFHFQLHWLTLIHVRLLTLLVISSKVHSLTIIKLRFFAGRCAPRCFLPALPVRWLLAVGVGFDSSMVIPLLYIVAPLTTNQLQPCISGLPRLCQDCRDWAWIPFGIVTWAYGLLIPLWVHLPSLPCGHILPLLAFSMGECVSQCFVPTHPVRWLFAVVVVAIPALSSLSLKMVVLPKINLARLVWYRHSNCDSGSDSGSYSAL